VLLTLERRVRRKSQGGFTLIEVLIAMLLLLVGVAGVLSLQLVSAKATSYSRHATEATIVAEDMMEELALIKTSDLPAGPTSDVVNAQAVPTAGGPYTRTFTAQPDGANPLIVHVRVVVEWFERDPNNPHSITLNTVRRTE
jgi:prepilin-type N-terminal cleavage/methylation domain-containing protein